MQTNAHKPTLEMQSEFNGFQTFIFSQIELFDFTPDFITIQYKHTPTTTTTQINFDGFIIN